MYLRDNIFFISCAARTGSTYLVHLLRSHPDLFCHGEVFGGDRVAGLLGIYGKKIAKANNILDKITNVRDNNPELFLYKYVLDSQGFNGIGFKYKTDEAMNNEYTRLTDIIKNDIDLKIIYLLRRNILAQYVSHQIVLEQTGVTLVHKEKDVPTIKKMKIDLNNCVNYINEVIKRQKQAENIYTRHRSIYVYYEDIMESSPNKDTEHKQIQDFLSVKTVELSSTTKKIVRKPLNDLVINYDEICAGLKESGLERHIYD